MGAIGKIANIASNSFKRRNFGVMLDKVMIRLKEKRRSKSHIRALHWYEEHAIDFESFARALDESLWQETLKACRAIEKAGHEKLKDIPLDMGGGGHIELLYFLARYLKARTIVETGVAAGWSSQTLLSALKANGEDGKLFSSDFPYFRYKEPEKLVGYVVDEALKDSWSLFIDGDKNNLPLIMRSLDEQRRGIDLFHYDSDKSYQGRAYAIGLAEPILTERAAVVFDDIQDNEHFADYAKTCGWTYKIFAYKGKYIGLTGPFMKGV